MLLFFAIIHLSILSWSLETCEAFYPIQQQSLQKLFPLHIFTQRRRQRQQLQSTGEMFSTIRLGNSINGFYNVNGGNKEQNYGDTQKHDSSRLSPISYQNYNENVKDRLLVSNKQQEQISSLTTIKSSRTIQRPKTLSSGTYTPEQILYPSFFPHVNNDEAEMRNDNNNNNNNNKRINEASGNIPLPIHAAINKIREALACFQRQDETFSIKKKKKRKRGQHQWTVATLNKTLNGVVIPTTVRIEQEINHFMDPLLILRHYQPPPPSSLLIHHPKFFMCNSESELEVAAIGSSLTLRGEQSLSNHDWDVISTLPSNVRVYGGGRFDYSQSKSERYKCNSEWNQATNGEYYDCDDEDSGGSTDSNAFMDGYFYFLPTVEIRKEKEGVGSRSRTTIAVNLHLGSSNASDELVDEASENYASLYNTIEAALEHLSAIYKDAEVGCASSIPPPTLPAIIRRTESSQEQWEVGINAIVDTFHGSNSGDRHVVDKVVLARKSTMHLGGDVHPLDILIRIRATSGDDAMRHLFFLQPNGDEKTFLGCTPERLFRIQRNGKVITEALAGTRMRGADASSDQDLLTDLISSSKDMSENIITQMYIRKQFDKLIGVGLLKLTEDGSKPFVRRLRHLQHICRSIIADVAEVEHIPVVARSLLESLHPTPAVCGLPCSSALEMIRTYETFDRGFYAGPVGFLGGDSADILVAIRSGILERDMVASPNDRRRGQARGTKITLYAGAGIVLGSTAQVEWAETAHKLSVMTSAFPSSPQTLRDQPTANSAWSIAVVDELIRCGVTEFIICPGSRSTPLTAAIVKMCRRHIGAVSCISVHDERGAGFRAVGFARRTGRPAVVVTSSGTAVANLLPSVIEADRDGLPMLVLTADRPYENRDVGANQAIDQIKIFGSNVRWFRDIPPPTHDVAVNVALADANHAVALSLALLGPVHLNVQFRENLAPDIGPIRGDSRDPRWSATMNQFDVQYFTQVPNFSKWASNGRPWQWRSSNQYYHASADSTDVNEVANLIVNSQRGVIVVGNIRTAHHGNVDLDVAMIAHFADRVGFPILASAMAGGVALRWQSSAVVPYADHLLRHPLIIKGLRPDLIIQIGAPIISTDVQNMIISAVSENSNESDSHTIAHVLIHPHHPTERADPSFTATHRISSSPVSFLTKLLFEIDERIGDSILSSDLTVLAKLGRALRETMPDITHKASDDCISRASGRCGSSSLTEPQLTLALRDEMSLSLSRRRDSQPCQLYFSNSMSIRDAETFFYPSAIKRGFNILPRTAANRGASGIDGIIASASGYVSGSSQSETTLIIGDVAALHDLNALHTLSGSQKSTSVASPKPTVSLTTVIVNNNGGGIFSYLPIAKYGKEVGFDEFFGTPTESFDFRKGAAAFGLPYARASSIDEFRKHCKEATFRNTSELRNRIIEANVIDRETNVAVHRKITMRANMRLDTWLASDSRRGGSRTSNQSLHNYAERVLLPFTIYNGKNTNVKADSSNSNDAHKKNLLLLHGWMGESGDWNSTISGLLGSAPSDWNIVVMDLPGHGNSPSITSSSPRHFNSLLVLEDTISAGKPATSSSQEDLSVEHGTTDLGRDFVDCEKGKDLRISVGWIAETVLSSFEKLSIGTIDVIAGYSLGGRVALAMKRVCAAREIREVAMNGGNTAGDGSISESALISKDTKFVLLSAYPGDLSKISTEETSQRIQKDDNIAASMMVTSNRENLLETSASPEMISASTHLWAPFLNKWYGMPLWGELQNFDSDSYRSMITRRRRQLSRRAEDLSLVLSGTSPGRNPKSDWAILGTSDTLFLAGSQDLKYSRLGRRFVDLVPASSFREILGAGHALLVEAPNEVAEIMSSFLWNAAGVAVHDTQSSEGDINAELRGLLHSRDSIAQTRIPRGRQNFVSNLSPFKDGSFLTECSDDVALDQVNITCFSIGLGNRHGEKGISGVGWGIAALREQSEHVHRKGLIIELSGIRSNKASVLGIGEISPFLNLHLETLSKATQQISALNDILSPRISFSASSALALDGYLECFIDKLAGKAGFGRIALVASVRSGLEMSIISLSSLTLGLPMPQALAIHAPVDTKLHVMPDRRLPINGILLPNELARYSERKQNNQMVNYSSVKMKVGLGTPIEDAQRILHYMESQRASSGIISKIRLDANRAWSEKSAISFAAGLLESLPCLNCEWMEFVEEPLKKQDGGFIAQVQALEELYDATGIRYALDETLADVVAEHKRDFVSISGSLRQALAHNRGCAAFVLKPALLGYELSFRLARLARTELGIGAVFSSCFDSGIGLGVTAFLATLSDDLAGARLDKNSDYAHGLGTFEMLSSDTLSPPFSSYVDEGGTLDVDLLSRNMYGMSLRDITTPHTGVSRNENSVSKLKSVSQGNFLSSSAASGRQVTVEAVLPLPFSDSIACARFTDLPQQSRWSPWLRSVEYISNSETEWTLDVLGSPFRWRAVSSLTTDSQGITWQSVSGLRNEGVVTFIPLSSSSCTMSVKVSFIAPRGIELLFQRESSMLESFLKNKLLKWSLEMFRDVVKADLALERGDAELGDALFGAVEGRASAIEATLSYANHTMYPDFQ